ncbi:MAG: hypothetical protein Q8R58_03935 [Sulfuricurvum sp.]|nr:hypothetical protein [Sulfuricurvum sp.]
MASKYHLENSSFNQDGTDTPRNKLNIIDSIKIHEYDGLKKEKHSLLERIAIVQSNDPIEEGDISDGII